MKYNRQFFNQVILTPSFNHQAIEWISELLWKEMETYWNNLGKIELDTGRKRTIRPKFDQVEYRPNAGLTRVKFRLFFLAQLGCQSSQIRKGYSAIIRTKFRQNSAKIRRSLDLNF